MKENEVLETLAKVGLESQDALDSWSSSARLLSALDAIGRDGGTALIKVDGGRNDSLVYTVVVSVADSVTSSFARMIRICSRCF